jgi:hypothetical protein
LDILLTSGILAKGKKWQVLRNLLSRPSRGFCNLPPSLPPRNGTIVPSLLVCALWVSGAIFLMLEMDRPFNGLLQISDAPLCNALAHLGH